eukprot:1151956-Pelagomonas_calceolata.AAC.5
MQGLTTMINTRHALCFHGGFWGVFSGHVAAQDGEGKSGRPGAWRATLQIPIRSVFGSLLD